MDNPIAENIMGTLGAVCSLLYTFIYPTDLANNAYRCAGLFRYVPMPLVCCDGSTNINIPSFYPKS